MSNKIEDGGHAFPMPAYLDGPDGKGAQLIVMESGGMSLRDWFAGQALSACGPGVWSDCKDGARFCYDYADAMIAERTRDAK